jgi:hypothetical protein
LIDSIISGKNENYFRETGYGDAGECDWLSTMSNGKVWHLWCESSRFISTLRQLTCSRTHPIYCRCTVHLILLEPAYSDMSRHWKEKNYKLAGYIVTLFHMCTFWYTLTICFLCMFLSNNTI